MKDFFFGNINRERIKNIYSIELHQLTDIAEKVDADYFTKQLNRLLSSVGGNLIVEHGSSMPSLYKLLDKTHSSDIGMVEVGARTDINDSVKATLECSLYLENGILNLRPHWCAYKEIRADEIISSLLAPLHENNLISKTFTIWSEGETERFPEDIESQVSCLFSLSGYPYYATSDDEPRMIRYTQEINSMMEKSKIE